MKMLAILAMTLMVLLAIGAFASGDVLAGVVLVLLFVAVSWFLGAGKTRRRRRAAVSRGRTLTPSEEAVRNLYYSNLGEINRAKANKNYRTMLLSIEQAIPILSNFVDATSAADGEFVLTSIPAIELGCRYWAALGNVDRLRTLEELVRSKSELQPWAELVANSFADVDIYRQIISVLSETPGILQNKLGRELGVNGRACAMAVKTMDDLGIISREKKGNTYKLFLLE